MKPQQSWRQTLAGLRFYFAHVAPEQKKAGAYWAREIERGLEEGAGRRARSRARAAAEKLCDAFLACGERAAAGLAYRLGLDVDRD